MTPALLASVKAKLFWGLKGTIVLSPKYELKNTEFDFCNLDKQAFDLAIDESSFTGETEPALKYTDINGSKKNNNITQRRNIAFMGTLVRTGNGKVDLFKIYFQVNE